MKSKSDIIDVISQFYHMIVTQFHTKVQVFHSKNDHEFVIQYLTVFFSKLMTSFTRNVLIYHNRTPYLSVRTVISLRWLVPYVLVGIVLNVFGQRMSWLLHILLTERLLVLLTIRLFFTIYLINWTYVLKFFGVFVMFVFMPYARTNLIHVLSNAPFSITLNT